MRKLVVLSFVSLDGVMQAPGGPEEDPSGDFRYGGWVFPYFDEFGGQIMDEQIKRPIDLLLGRRTYEIFASYWPDHDDVWPEANRATKYVASRGNPPLTWENSALLEGDVAEAVRTLKAEDGPELQVHGSGDFIQTLLEHDLVDEFWLKTFPVLLGAGKRLFASGVIPAAFQLTDCQVSPSGVVYAKYRRAGDVETGSF